MEQNVYLSLKSISLREGTILVGTVRVRLFFWEGNVQEITARLNTVQW